MKKTETHFHHITLSPDEWMEAIRQWLLKKGYKIPKKHLRFHLW